MSFLDSGRRWLRTLARRQRLERPDAAAIAPPIAGQQSGAPSASRSPFDRIAEHWRAAARTPLRPFPMSALSATGGSASGSVAFPPSDRSEGDSFRQPVQARDFYRELSALGLPPRTLRAVHAFVATLPSWLAPPTARRDGESGIELTWSAHDGRRFRARIDRDGMVIYSARLGERGRFDGAEPIGDRLSPIVLHAIRQLAP
jgi:hypothetical protein